MCEHTFVSHLDSIYACTTTNSLMQLSAHWYIGYIISISCTCILPSVERPISIYSDLFSWTPPSLLQDTKAVWAEKTHDSTTLLVDGDYGCGCTRAQFRIC